MKKFKQVAVVAVPVILAFVGALAPVLKDHPQAGFAALVVVAVVNAFRKSILEDGATE